MGNQIANNSQVVTINTANSNLDGTGTIGNLFAAGGTYGSLLQTIRIQSTGSTSVGMIRLFIKPAGGSFNLIKEVKVPETTLNDPPYPAFGVSLININLSLENGDTIGVSTENAETFVVSAFGYDITGFV